MGLNYLSLCGCPNIILLENLWQMVPTEAPCPPLHSILALSSAPSCSHFFSFYLYYALASTPTSWLSPLSLTLSLPSEASLTFALCILMPFFSYSESLNFFVCKGGMMIVLASDPGCRSQVGCQDVKFFKNSNPLGDC